MNNNVKEKEDLKLLDVIVTYLLDSQKGRMAAYEIAAGHRSLSGTISYVSGRIRFLPVTMTAEC